MIFVGFLLVEKINFHNITYIKFYGVFILNLNLRLCFESIIRGEVALTLKKLLLLLLKFGSIFNVSIEFARIVHVFEGVVETTLSSKEISSVPFKSFKASFTPDGLFVITGSN